MPSLHHITSFTHNHFSFFPLTIFLNYTKITTVDFSLHMYPPKVKKRKKEEKTDSCGNRLVGDPNTTISRPDVCLVAGTATSDIFIYQTTPACRQKIQRRHRGLESRHFWNYTRDAERGKSTEPFFTAHVSTDSAIGDLP